MKIGKKPRVVASTEPEVTTVEELNTPTEDCEGYKECIDYIRSAISSLGPKAKTDIVAREAIANLSVVLFDLQ